MLKPLKHCSRCILPETAPNIAFDEKGVCNYCRSYQNFEYRGENALARILNRHRNPQKKYECIVNISGGRDSAYALLKVKKDYNMKLLAVNYENPFTDTQAKKNIKNMVKTLDIDLVKFKLNSQIHETCFRNNLIAWFKNPSPAMVPMMCIGCKIIWKNILQIAKRYDISLIINGGNPYEYTSFKKELLNVSREADLKSTYLKNLTGLVKESLKNYLYLMPQYLPVLFKGYLFSNQYSIGSRLYSRNIERIDLFHFIRWDEKDIVSRITKELKWDYPRKLKSTWRFDCKIGHLKDYMYIKTLGMTEKDDFYAKMVREGLMTREETLSRLERENEIHLDIIKEIFTQLGLSTKLIST
ncbi:MAG: ATPase [candidate division WOR-3 bacterium]|nr:MAG: ATPase [candidate division WOR-3 bacterium]